MPAALTYTLEITAPQGGDSSKPYAARIPMSAEQFIAWDHGNRLAEWVDGEAYIYMTTTDLHERILIFLSTLFQGFADVTAGGVVRRGPYGMRANPSGPIREPDLVYVSAARQHQVTEALLLGPPDLVVEVISPDSVRRDRVTKFHEYETAGVPEYWLIDARPRRRDARFFTLRDGSYVDIAPDAGIVRSAAVPGLWIRPEWLWSTEVTSLRCLAEVVGSERLASSLTARRP